MLSERDIEAAHPDAFDFVWGNLPSAKHAEFNRHLSGCPYCQAVVTEYNEIGRIIKLLPPHVEPTVGLEDRTVAGMVAALAQKQAEVDRPADTDDRTATQVYRLPEPPAEPQVPPMVTRLPVWRRHQGRLAAIVAAAAVIIVASALILPRILSQPAQVTVAIPLHATAAAKVFGVGSASGQATARQAGESWTITLTVRGLKPLAGDEVYACWWAAPGSTKLHPLLTTGGSFVVGDSGPVTLTMTTGVDPRRFPTMEITEEPPGNGAISGVPLLIG